MTDKEKKAAYDRAYYQKNRQKKLAKQKTYDRCKGYQRNYDLQRHYGITLDDYNRMFAEQNGCCAICSIHQSELKKAFAVDHCHTTGKVRGLLCFKCNTALGLFKDDQDLLNKAIHYLQGD